MSGEPSPPSDGPEPGEPSALKAPEGLPPALVAEIRTALLEARVAAEQRAAQGPLRDIASALQQNAEALRAVQETQERIARTVDRSDRTEAVLQSTQALNDTFRGVRVAQDALVHRLEKEERKPLRYGLAAALLVGGTAALAGWFLVHREDDLRGRIEELRASVDSGDREAWEASRRSAEKELLDRVESLSRQTSLTEAERREKEKELTARGEELEALRREGDAAAARRGVMEVELARLRRENTALRSEASSARAAAEEAALGLREAEARRAREEAAPAPVPPVSALETAAAASPVRPEGPAESPPPALGPQAVTDGGQVRKVLDALNALLAGAGGRDLYRVTEAGAVDGDRLVTVLIESRGPDGAIRRSFQAAEARFVLHPASRSLEIRLRGGSVTYLGRRTVRFLDDRHTAYLEVDPAPFSASGNPVITVR